MPGGTFRFCETGWRKSCPAGGFGGKKRGKGNRQGVLSRQITRRSGKIAKQYYKKFCNFEGSLAKDPKGLFDKLTVRLAGRYISFLRNGLAKKLPSRRFRREEKCERKPSGFPFAFNNPPQRQNCKTELQNTFCNFEGSLAKDPKGLFDKLTVRLAGRYISFLRLDVEKVALVIARPCRGRGNLAGSLRIFGKLRQIRNILCEISTSLRPPAMTRLGHLTSREPSGSLRLSKSLRFAE